MSSRPRTARRVRATFVLTGLLSGVVVACGGSDANPDPVARARAERAAERPFAATGVWNSRLRADAPLDPSSNALVASLNREVANAIKIRYGPTVNTIQYSTPVYTVSRHQRRVRVTLDNPAGYARSLRRAIASVPIPRRAKPARGSDAHMVIWQPSTDTMWEFWKMQRRADGWHARSAGKMPSVSRNPGYFAGPSGFPWGATASSLPLLGGLMRPSELRRGRIDHALALAIPHPRGGTWSFPAQRTDGFAREPDAIPEGARFRLDPRVNVDDLHLPRPLRAMAVAAQRYGIIVRDTAATVVFYAEDPSTMRRNPYPKIFGRQPMYRLLSRFPWNKLQVLKMDLRTYRGPGN